MTTSSETQTSQCLEPSSEVELVCLRSADEPLRSRILPHGPTVLIRQGISEFLPVEGEIFTVEVERAWVFGRTQYVTGHIPSSSICLDVGRLELPPLHLEPWGPWDPEDIDSLDHLPEDLAAELERSTGLEHYEMEQVLPEDSITMQYEDDAMLEAQVLRDLGDRLAAEKLLGDLLTADLRCLDAHAHLGNFLFDSDWPGALDRTTRHYAAGAALGSAALPKGFSGLLPWGLIDNRPYLRCLHGLGLCRWRAGDFAQARTIFRRMLRLNPGDNQGVRFLLPDVEAGQPWRPGM
ncbi:MAG: tetratricopeptide repeat protein [Acidobacteria bacterium]|nr:tetratricopeptide repeat protein [Acidobacteriota bacterium]